MATRCATLEKNPVPLWQLPLNWLRQGRLAYYQQQASRQRNEQEQWLQLLAGLPAALAAEDDHNGDKCQDHLAPDAFQLAVRWLHKHSKIRVLALSWRGNLSQSHGGATRQPQLYWSMPGNPDLSGSPFLSGNPASGVDTQAVARGTRWCSLPCQRGEGWLLVSAEQPSSRQTEQLAEPADLGLQPLLYSLASGLDLRQQCQQRQHQLLQQERRWQAAELHDTVAQTLGYLQLRAGCLANQYQDAAPLAAALNELQQQSRMAYRQTRDLIAAGHQDLAPSGLEGQLTQLVEEFEQRSALALELDNQCSQRQLGRLSAQHQHQLLMVVREAVCNVVRHAHASHARIQLRWLTDCLECCIDDNGRGIEAGQRDGSFGIQIMAERARRLGASLDIEQRQPSGTRVCLTLPHATSPGEHP